MNKKDMVDLIHKYSQIPQLHKSKPTQISNKSQDVSNSGAGNLWNNKQNQPISQTTTNYKRNLESVKNMQFAINDLAISVMQNNLFVKSLNDFIADQYISSLDPNKKGIELQSAPQINKKNQTDTYEIDVVMSNLQQISQKNNLKVNGIWDVKTDNALRNILGLAYSLLQIEGDFRLKNQNYTSKNWENFNKLLTGYTIKNNLVSLPTEELNKRAEAIFTHVKSIKNLYNSFKYQIQSKPEYRSLIEGKKYFDKYDDSIMLTEQEENILENPYTSITIQDKDPNSDNIVDFTIPLTAFLNKESFSNFMKKYNISDEKILIKYLNSFTKKINELRG